MTLEEEMTDVCDWAWTEGLDAIDAKDEQYAEASAHVEMFLVLGAVLADFGWTREELIPLLDECVFEDMTPADGVTH
jgi:hypothetical protein